jgi:hypothetical protein
MAFIFGVCGAVMIAVMPAALNTASNAAVNLASRSRMGWVKRRPAVSRSAVNAVYHTQLT